MDTSTEIPIVWNQLAEGMYLKDLPTAKVELSQLTSFSFGRFQINEGLPDIARPAVNEHGYMVALQLKAVPFVEHFVGRKKVSSGFYPMGAVSVIDLQDQPGCLLPDPFDALVVHVTQATLDEVAYAHHVPRVEQLVWPYGTIDPVVHHLGQALLYSLEHPHHASKIVVDQILYALNCHFVSSYGGVKISARQFRGGLSPRQMQRATEFLEAHLDGNIALHQVAEVCELSVSHFARAFKETFRRPPHAWLIERRVEKARNLMMNTPLPLADIAVRCGFTDQSGLNRSFKRIHGVAPGMWRRTTTRGSSAPGDSN